MFVDEMHTRQVPVSVKTVRLVSVYTVRKEISPDLKVEKVVDPHIRALLQERLKSFGGDAKKAFGNLDENPIWLNKEKGICIKRVRITGVNVATALHDKRDMQGRLLLDGEGNTLPVDYVSTSNNHHVAIFRDAEGNCQEHIVSFFEAMDRIRQGLPVVDKDYNKDKGWAFLFTMKQNEYFVFPDTQTGFDPQDMDLNNPANYELISPHLFRVQKLATKYYVFRHHLETTVEDVNALRDVTWKRITSLAYIDQIVKVRVNHIGQIVAVGEY